MSMDYDNTDISVGYWLAKIWAFEYVSSMNHKKESATCACYLIMAGLNILLRKIRTGRLGWLLSIAKEIMAICLKIIKQANCANMLIAVLPLLKAKVSKRQQNILSDS
jgi:hypothetical protein